MKIRVISYDKENDCHRCITEKGKRERIDITVDGYFPDGINPEHLVGMELECDYTFPYISIAMGIK
jgi:hypothetical protein